MKKRGITKDKLSIVVNKKILKKFKEFCKETSINKSQLLEKLIITFLKEKGK